MSYLSGTSTSSEVRSPTSTRTEVRSPTSTSSEVRSPTRTSTWANTRGNFTSTVTGGAGAGATRVTINIPGMRGRSARLGDYLVADRYRRIPFLGGAPAGIMHSLDGFSPEDETMKIARIPVSSGPKGVVGLIGWARATHPMLYNAVAIRMAPRIIKRGGMGSLGVIAATGDPLVSAAANNPGMAQTILNTFKELVTVALPVYQQQKIFDLQLKRAQAGQAMLDTDKLADMSSMKIGVDASTRNTGLMAVGGILAAILGYKLLTR